jgi:CBS domain-containing protein
MHAAINTSIVTIEENESALTAARLMKESEAGCLIVVDHNGTLSGIVTGRDLVLKVLAPNKPAHNVRVSEVMTASPTTALASDIDMKAMARILSRARVRRLPIVDEKNRPVGIITLEDMLVYTADMLHSLGAAVSSYLTVARLKSVDLARH